MVKTSDALCADPTVARRRSGANFVCPAIIKLMCKCWTSLLLTISIAQEKRYLFLFVLVGKCEVAGSTDVELRLHSNTWSRRKLCGLYFSDQSFHRTGRESPSLPCDQRFQKCPVTLSAGNMWSQAVQMHPIWDKFCLLVIG